LTEDQIKKRVCDLLEHHHPEYPPVDTEFLDGIVILFQTASHHLAMEAKHFRAALETIAGWDCLNPPQPELCADLPWLRRLVDQALWCGEKTDAFYFFDRNQIRDAVWALIVKHHHYVIDVTTPSEFLDDVVALVQETCESAVTASYRDTKTLRHTIMGWPFEKAASTPP
jgi:hypothetical protein